MRASTALTVSCRQGSLLGSLGFSDHKRRKRGKKGRSREMGVSVKMRCQLLVMGIKAKKIQPRRALVWLRGSREWDPALEFWAKDIVMVGFHWHSIESRVTC